MREVIGIIALALCDVAIGHTHRSQAAIHQFRLNHPCPSTGRYTGHCHGYVIDHRVALCVGGQDIADNLRWQEFDLSHFKDRWECLPGWQQKLVQCERNSCLVP